MPTISLSQFKEAAAKKQADITKYMESQGFILNPTSGTFVQNPNFQTQNEQLSTIQKQLDIAKTQQELVPESTKEKELGKLLTPDEAAGFGVSYGSTKEDVVGKTYLNQSAREKMAALQNSQELINVIKQASQKVNTGRFKGLSQLDEALGGWIGTNQDAQQLSEASKSFIGNLSKTVGGESGVLTDQDIARVQSSLPKVTDNKKTAERKIKTLEQILNKAIDRAKNPGKPIDLNATEEAKAKYGLDY